MTFPLFDSPTAPERVDRYAGLGHDARRTARQVESLAMGVHPATGRRLHPDAADPADRAAPGLRCGGCAKRWLKHERGFDGWKCDAAGTATNDGTDLRLWWSACALFEAGAPG